MDYKIILGLTSVIIAFLSYSFYFRDISNHQTKPHAFSWFVWGILMSISFFIQATSNGGPGSWVIGFTALICFVISYMAFKRGMRSVKLLDWFSLVGAFFSLLLYFVIKQPVFSVILITLTYSLGFFPTFRKSFNKPQDETLITFVLNGLKFFISLFALSSISFVTVFYPVALVIINWSFAAMLVIRRRALSN